MDYIQFAPAPMRGLYLESEPPLGGHPGFPIWFPVGLGNRQNGTQAGGYGVVGFSNGWARLPVPPPNLLTHADLLTINRRNVASGVAQTYRQPWATRIRSLFGGV